jgi:hypothetical protein
VVLIAYLEIYWERIALKFEVPKKKAISIEKAWLTFRFSAVSLSI